MKLFPSSIVILLAFSLNACKKDHTYLFRGEPRLQFGIGNEGLQDTVKYYSFYYESDNTLQDTIYFPMNAIGGLGLEDRHYSLEQVMLEGEENAAAGIHFKSFSDPALKDLYVVKAGEVMATVPVIMLRDPSLKNKSVKLQFRVRPDENFQPGELRLSWRRLEFTDRLSRPAAWNSFNERYYWGKYSYVKHDFMIRKTGKTWDETFMSSLNRDVSETLYWVDKLKELLADYNTAHPTDPLKDEDGNLVIFP